MINQLKRYAIVILAMIFWSFSFIWFKEANETLRPMTIVFLRLVIATAIIGCYMLITKRFAKIKKEDRKLFFLLAFCEPFLYFLGESHGLTLVSATVGSVIIAIIPVVISLAAWIFLKEKLSTVNYAGIILSFFGIVVFVMNNDGELIYNAKGMALMFTAALSAVGYGIFLGKLVPLYDSLTIIFMQSLLGVLFFLPVFLVTELKYVVANPFSGHDLLPVAKLSVFASIGAFALFTISVREIGVTRSNVFTNFIPIFTSIFSFFILGEQLTARNMIGIIIVICGLLLTQLKNGKKKIDKKENSVAGS